MARLNKTKSLEQVNSSSTTIDGVIDVLEICLECKALFVDRRALYIDLRIRKPYYDLTKFYHDYDRIPSVFADEMPRMPEERKKEDNRDLLKRPPQAPYSSKDLLEDMEQRKRMKREDSTVSANYQPLPMIHQQSSNRDSKAVVEEDRKDIRDILTRTIKKNAEFKEVNA